MAEHELPSRLLDCPSCGTPLVVLPIPVYPRAADWDKSEFAELPGDITDLEGKRVAKFTVTDADGKFKCPQCLNTSFAPGARR
jgi:hypothetical protein